MCIPFLQEDVIDGLMIGTDKSRPFYIHLFHLVLSLWYTAIHSLVLFSTVITLNVSLNSSNNALMIILISNNFIEV